MTIYLLEKIVTFSFLTFIIVLVVVVVVIVGLIVGAISPRFTFAAHDVDLGRIEFGRRRTTDIEYTDTVSI